MILATIALVWGYLPSITSHTPITIQCILACPTFSPHYPSLCAYVYIYFHIYYYESTYSTYLPTILSIYLSIHLSIYPSIYLSIYLYLHIYKTLYIHIMIIIFIIYLFIFFLVSVSLSLSLSHRAPSPRSLSLWNLRRRSWTQTLCERLGHAWTQGSLQPILTRLFFIWSFAEGASLWPPIILQDLRTKTLSLSTGCHFLDSSFLEGAGCEYSLEMPGFACAFLTVSLSIKIPSTSASARRRGPEAKAGRLVRLPSSCAWSPMWAQDRWSHNMGCSVKSCFLLTTIGAATHIPPPQRHPDLKVTCSEGGLQIVRT